MTMDQGEPGNAGRRQFLQSAVAAGVGGYLMSQSAGAQTAPKPIPPGTLGAAGAGPDRPKIAMLVHPKMVMQDLIGPMTVFNLMRCEIHLVWKTREPVMTELGITVAPTTTFAECPEVVDVLFVPGGLDGTIALMDDAEVLKFLADRGKTARYITSDCTGSLLLGAAGLLQGYKATSHWMVRDELALMGAIPVHDRVVQDRNRITGGGVTAGIDFGLTLAALLRSREEAETIQLVIEYAPAPPFDAGTPETAPKAIVDRLMSRRGPTVEQARQKAQRAGRALKR
ncbi:DJ-1/PfpI family protein [Sphingomonas sp. G-3-2-10]|uniref:DJ-1/PfpI family protein n=1 Tax=Sphingomonas sp. G-3-2-10 TaxID=2728838 RepID=UPI0019D1AED4|nr:DJ-1/PfpI family protein [Sphingomonas sp. G-3-2-10]